MRLEMAGLEAACMSLRPQSVALPVPDDTARIAQAAFRRRSGGVPAAFRRGTPSMLLRDRLGAMFDDAGFGRPLPRTRSALLRAVAPRAGHAHAVPRGAERPPGSRRRARPDRPETSALAPLADAGFDHSVLCEFRARLLQHDAGGRLLERLLDTAREGGLLQARGRQRTDSTHVLGALRTPNRLERVGETLRAALNAIAVAAPGWLGRMTPPDRHERHDRRVENVRLPGAAPKRAACAAPVGADGFLLLDAPAGPGTPAALPELPAVAVLRRVWSRHFERTAPDAGGKGGDSTPGARLCDLRASGPDERVKSPYDPDARFRRRSGRSWTGTMVHPTETCDADAPRLVVHADTTDARVHEAMRVAIHTARAAKDLAPAQRLADAASMGADLLLDARERHGIDLIGPQHRDMSWQGAVSEAFSIAGFAVDWDGQVARCPEGKESVACEPQQQPAAAQVRPGAGALPSERPPSLPVAGALHALSAHPGPQSDALSPA